MDIRGWGAALVDLVLPTECAGCAAPPSIGAWCARCVARLGEPSWPRAAGGLVVLAAGRYSGPLRIALLRYKERGRRDLAAPLAQRLLPGLDLLSGPGSPPDVLPGLGVLSGVPGSPPDALPGTDRLSGRPHSSPDRLPGLDVVREDPPHLPYGRPLPTHPTAHLPGDRVDAQGGLGGTWLVPAPSRPAAARARGGDHVLRLARALAAERPDIRVAPALSLARRTRDSVGLDPAQRVANLEGRLLVRHSALPPPGSWVVLLDDVVTTGATLRACHSALRNAGVRAGSALVLCDATSTSDDHELPTGS